MRFPSIETHDGRRALSFLAIMGGAMVFSLFIWIALYLLRNHEVFIFYLAVAAHVQVLVGMTAMGWAMGRRVNVSAGKDGIKLDDNGGGDTNGDG